MIDWYTSSYSGGNNDCVQVAAAPAHEVVVENKDTGGEVFVVRDSKNPGKDPLVFTRAEWDAFIAGAKGGEFDSATLAARQASLA